MHIVTSLSRIQRGARLPSSALCHSRNSTHSGHGLGEVSGSKVHACDAHRHFLPFFQRVLERLVLLLEDLDGLLESLERRSMMMHQESAEPDTGWSVRSVCVTLSQSALSCSELKREKQNKNPIKLKKNPQINNQNGLCTQTHTHTPRLELQYPLLA